MPLKSFTCTFTVADFSIYFAHNIIVYKFLNALSQRTTFVSFALLENIVSFVLFQISHFLYALLDITNFGFTVANDKLYEIVAFSTFSIAMIIADL